MSALQSRAALNDFTIKLANVNGTGSSSANGLLMKAIFRMGIPVVGKNIFPSNIQGLPTWYEIRVTEKGYHGRSGDVHLMVAMNAKTYTQDLAELSPGGVLLYDSTWPHPEFMNRSDITVIGVPFARMCNGAFKAARSRILMKNMAYIGSVVALLDLDMKVIHELVREMFAAKPKLIDLNLQALTLGFDHVKEHFDGTLDIKVEARDLTTGKIMIDGNEATALGCVFGGATFGAWYPITPSTSIMDGFTKYCRMFRVDPETQEHKYCIIQAEDELAAAGMVVGASWNGARAFTPTSGAGISLMSEFIGYAYYTEIPMVLFDVQRTGPSTGMPTRTQQCDMQICAYASHGDTCHILLFPSQPQECFEMAAQALDLAERFQTPVFVLSDLDIGMNDWMVDALSWDDSYQPDRGKVLSKTDLEKMDKFHRYLDVDGDYIPYRTLPGTDPKGAYFTRGSGHNKWGSYTEEGQEYKELVDRLRNKWASAADKVPAPVLKASKGSSNYAILSVGSCDGAVIEACDRLEAQGVHLDYMRVRGFPFCQQVEDFIDAHDTVFVIEQNRDAQLLNLLLVETNVAREKLVPILHYSGEPLDYRFVFQALHEALALRKTA
ncbi:MAG: ferredoxin oxidoreductase [Robiginitomaculum sp.]|nr:MAG: ferredoxin oxidoreductase [Robiginitomaculum sp.]